MTAIAELARQGQSLWLDNIRRQLITSESLLKVLEDAARSVAAGAGSPGEQRRR